MAIRYFCDACGEELTPSKLSIVGTERQRIATMEEMDPVTGKTITTMFCGKCSPKLSELIKELQKENKIIPLSRDLCFKGR